METSVQTPNHSRLRLAEAILKALFTTSPIKATEVIVKDDGEIVVKDAERASRGSRPTAAA
jgi:hypothetical protein